MNNNEIYEGDFIDNKKNGYGKLENIILGQHSIYEGEFINDKKHGIGTLEIKGNIITGKWENDAIGKYGIIKCKSDSIYEGEIKDIGDNFIKDGFGLLKDKHKSELYIGLFKNDLKDGFGIMRASTIILFIQFKQSSHLLITPQNNDLSIVPSRENKNSSIRSKSISSPLILK